MARIVSAKLMVQKMFINSFSLSIRLSISTICLGVIVATHKPFENFQPYFTSDGKRCMGDVYVVVAKWERKMYILGNTLLTVGFVWIINGPFKNI